MKKKPELNLRTRALRYLARREYSRAELRGKLLSYINADEAFEQESEVNLEELLDDLTARGWLSDARAAAQWVHVKRNRFGTLRITHELRMRGITEELISAALPALKQTELEAVHRVWKIKFSSLPQDAKEKARQVRFLQSRGFALDSIFQILRCNQDEES